MKRIIVLWLGLFLCVPAFAAEPPKTEEQKTLYALGQLLAEQLMPLALSPAELEWVKQGVTDAVTGKKAEVDADVYNQQILSFLQTRRTIRGENLASDALAFVAKAAKEKGAVKTDSGLVYLSRRDGSGVSPLATDRVKVHYQGTLVDGSVFDSSYKRGQPAEFPLDGVISCWSEGVQRMKPGGKARLICPPATAYGDRGAGGLIPPNATLIFEVELLEILK